MELMISNAYAAVLGLRQGVRQAEQATLEVQSADKADAASRKEAADAAQ